MTNKMDMFGSSRDAIKEKVVEPVLITVPYDNIDGINLIFSKQYSKGYTIRDWEELLKGSTVGNYIVKHQVSLGTGVLQIRASFAEFEYVDYYSEEDFEWRKTPVSVKTRNEYYFVVEDREVELSRVSGGLFSKDYVILPECKSLKELGGISSGKSVWARVELSIVKNTQNLIYSDCWVAKDSGGTAVNCGAEDHVSLRPLDEGTSVLAWGYFKHANGHNSLEIERWDILDYKIVSEPVSKEETLVKGLVEVASKHISAGAIEEFKAVMLALLTRNVDTKSIQDLLYVHFKDLDFAHTVSSYLKEFRD